ncbi:MAG: DAK2 domain-containing protein [Lachnospiraceae bacterium]|nr:DAK2 domain-containing protein [Lachnospiraceae bacterium]MBP5275932.1 DAK2 domain-containing protein [Lachnospiraceae bacterium]
MSVSKIDAKLLSKMFMAGACNLEKKKEYINELNVFPVPDGDTGTNMTMTIMSAYRELSSLTDPEMAAVCKAISSGSLRGARGNSGVILSQLIRGFTKVATEHKELDVNIVTEALQSAVNTAYKAVMKPKEGTILTVASGIYDKASELQKGGEKDLEKFINEVVAYGDEVLLRTPELLPVLKQAGVVDSGGQGLMEVLHGAQDAFLGKEVDTVIAPSKSSSKSERAAASMENLSTSEIKFGYCTEFIILLNKPFNVKQEIDFKSFLESIGDSIVVVADDEIVKVHVHTNDPGLAFQRALKYGQLSNMKVDNMRLEHNERVIQFEEGKSQSAENVKADEKVATTEEAKEFGFIAVSAGSGLCEIFKSIGVDHIIEGGQTMNPSTEDMMNAIAKVNAKNVFILPNNKNIIMAANQARDLEEDKNVVVIPSTTIPQGISAMINYMGESSVEDNTENMIEGTKSVKTGQVTYAVRDTEIDDKTINKGDYMGIGDKGILSVGPDRDTVIKDMVAEMVDDDSSVITIYYGEDVKEDDAEAIKASLEEAYEDVEVELQNGGQPIYYYIISVE